MFHVKHLKRRVINYSSQTVDKVKFDNGLLFLEKMIYNYIARYAQFYQVKQRYLAFLLKIWDNIGDRIESDKNDNN